MEGNWCRTFPLSSSSLSLQVSSGSPGPNQLVAGRERLGGGPDLGVGVVGGLGGSVGGEEMVLTTAFDHHGIAPPHITMHPTSV